MIRTYAGVAPSVHSGAYVHDSAEVIGRVVLKKGASIWPQCVLRGDIERIVIGEGSNIQDLSVLHTRRNAPTLVGRDVTVGHGVILHGARVGNGALIGMGAVVMEARIGERAMVAAGSLVPAGMRVPARSLAMGMPARIVRKLKPGELKSMRSLARSYLGKVRAHRRSSKAVTGS